jgi:hypothetical protein
VRFGPRFISVTQLAGAGELKITGDAAACDRIFDPFDKFGTGVAR